MAPPPVEAQYLTRYDLLCIEGAPQDLPALLSGGFVDREDGGVLSGLAFDDVGDDIVAYGEIVPLLLGNRTHLTRRHNAFSLVTDVDQDAVGVGPHHDAFHYVASPQGLYGLHLIEELTHILHGV